MDDDYFDDDIESCEVQFEEYSDEEPFSIYSIDEFQSENYFTGSFFDKPKDPQHFSAIRISISSPEKIRERSYGEVKKPETINYRTYKPERDGLFCTKIFGPIKDYECSCGRYKNNKHRGIICEKCGVEVIPSKVRRERLGHIDLATPVAHIWFLKSLPSKIGSLLDITSKDLERVVYFKAFVITDPGMTPLKFCEVMSEDKFLRAKDEYGGDSFEGGIGAKAIRECLKALDIDELSVQLRQEMCESTIENRRKKVSKRLKAVEAFKTSGNKPEWMILECIPVLPPELRPLVPLNGGRFATSDLNDLYRRVINHNNRLKRLLELQAPETIIRSEELKLQESVDALFYNGCRGRAIAGPNKRPLKSLTDMLTGKEGRFRQNLLGKRVDYSGRTVIVPGPDLKLHQCGLPKEMALELFKPFIYSELAAHHPDRPINASDKFGFSSSCYKKIVERGYVSSSDIIATLYEKRHPKVLSTLLEVIKEHPVLLNRQPTLHRMGIQAFEPIIIEGKAIQLHPMVCKAFNADFDGDEMAIYLPLSIESQIEARVLQLATNNIISPANGKPIVAPSQDIVLGIYYMTRHRLGAKGEHSVFSSPGEVRIAFDVGGIDLHARITVRMKNQEQDKYESRIDTTVGRILLSEILPNKLPFSIINKEMNKNALAELVSISMSVAGNKDTVIMLDDLKDIGFRFATTSGISICIDDLEIPNSKDAIINWASEEVRNIESQFYDGLMFDEERHNKIINTWTTANRLISVEVFDNLSKEIATDCNGNEVISASFNSLHMMIDSGSRGSVSQIIQLLGMRGIFSNPSGNINEMPILSSLREGQTMYEYFQSTHGTRKGLIDTALKTAYAGYLARRLIDVAHDVMITGDDCGTLDGLLISALTEDGCIVESLGDRILGRVALDNIYDPITDEVLVEADQEIGEHEVRLIEDAFIQRVKVRSTITCQSNHGVCAKCYGRDLARARTVNIGEPVGIIAAQSLSEPCTQMTMKTYKDGGVASAPPFYSSIYANVSGTVKYINLKTIVMPDGRHVVLNRSGEIAVVDMTEKSKQRDFIKYGSKINIPPDGFVKEGDLLAEMDPFFDSIFTEYTGRVKFVDIIPGATLDEQSDGISGHSRMVIIDSEDTDLNPHIAIIENDCILVRYFLPVGTWVKVQDSEIIYAGTVIAKKQSKLLKHSDITVGFTRIAELFEARKPSDCAVIAEISGRVLFGRKTKGKSKIIIDPELGEPKEYSIPKTRCSTFYEGDNVKAGEALTDGQPNPHDILKIFGCKDAALHLIHEIRKVYRQHDIDINEKHIEIIVRKMLGMVRIKDAGDTSLLVGDLISRQKFEYENYIVFSAGKELRPATAEPVLLGITSASLSTDSFLSAASFQETSKVLTNAAFQGKIDFLRGLKENVILGRLIPAGTGLPCFKGVKIKS